MNKSYSKLSKIDETINKLTRSIIELEVINAKTKENFIIINNLVKNWENIIEKDLTKSCYPLNYNSIQKKLIIATTSPLVSFKVKSNSDRLIEKIAIIYGYKIIEKISVKYINK